jgi:prepilin-type processing-associated H-X9-DG protein
VFPVRRPIEVVVAATIALLAVGLVLGGVQKFREASQVAACQNNLRVMYQGLTDYADAHDGDYPRVGGPNAPTAGAFVSVLVEARQYPADLKLICAADPDPNPAAVGFRPDPLFPPGPDVLNQVGYVYTLGYRGPDGGLVGLRRADGLTDDHTPLAADLPARAVAPAVGPTSPHGRGQNVLFADGRVQFLTTATVGPNGDDIYRNDAGWVKAGLHRLDASLGRATDAP